MNGPLKNDNNHPLFELEGNCLCMRARTDGHPNRQMDGGTCRLYQVRYLRLCNGSWLIHIFDMIDHACKQFDQKKTTHTASSQNMPVNLKIDKVNNKAPLYHYGKSIHY